MKLSSINYLHKRPVTIEMGGWDGATCSVSWLTERVKQSKESGYSNERWARHDRTRVRTGSFEILGSRRFVAASLFWWPLFFLEDQESLPLSSQVTFSHPFKVIYCKICFCFLFTDLSFDLLGLCCGNGNEWSRDFGRGGSVYGSNLLLE